MERQRRETRRRRALVEIMPSQVVSKSLGWRGVQVYKEVGTADDSQKLIAHLRNCNSPRDGSCQTKSICIKEDLNFHSFSYQISSRVKIYWLISYLAYISDLTFSYNRSNDLASIMFIAFVLLMGCGGCSEGGPLIAGQSCFVSTSWCNDVWQGNALGHT